MSRDVALLLCVVRHPSVFRQYGSDNIGILFKKTKYVKCAHNSLAVVISQTCAVDIFFVCLFYYKNIGILEGVKRCTRNSNVETMITVLFSTYQEYINPDSQRHTIYATLFQKYTCSLPVWLVLVA